jgi:hypothetical protein
VPTGPKGEKPTDVDRRAIWQNRTEMTRPGFAYRARPTLKIARAATPMSIWVSVSPSAAAAKAERLGLCRLCP